MSTTDVARRHQDLGARILAYLQGPYAALPAGAATAALLHAATVISAGAHALGAAGRGEPVAVAVILDEAQWTRLRGQTRPSDLLTLDPNAGMAVRIRDSRWLAARLAQPGGLWLHQRAAIVQDPGDRVPPPVRAALATFRERLDTEVIDRYRAFRDGLETADAALDPLGRSILLGQAVEAALALPVLARGEPCPPARWLAWYLNQVDPEGERIGALCARAAGPRAVDREAYATLRRLLDETLDRAGYGERLVREYRAIE